jgi:cytochrome c oxidase subunit III
MGGRESRREHRQATESYDMTTEAESGSHDNARGSLPPRPKELAMHFDNLNQQFQSGKLGMWLFLGQELLFFAGLFTAYAVYRGNNPEMFYNAHYFLDWKLGGVNTLVLLFSSLTAAWSVRCAQLEQRRGLIITLVLTLLCACAFMGIKYVEYADKIKNNVVWGAGFAAPDGELILRELEYEGYDTTGLTAASFNGLHDRGFNVPQSLVDAGVTADRLRALDEASFKMPAALEEAGYTRQDLREMRLGVFFAIYFCMTGLHGLHVLVGIGLYIWLLVRVFKGHFNRRHYGAVDNVALYWHIVDIIWIFLFPLLYLIH